MKSGLKVLPLSALAFVVALPVLAQTTTAPADAETYLAQFQTDDPEACFADLALVDAQMQTGAGDSAPPAVPVRAVVLVDGSGSMARQMDGRPKVELAREAAQNFVDSLPAEVEAALLVFGQQGDNTDAGKEQSCAAIDTLAPMTADRAQLTAGIAGIEAVGWTPLAAGMRAAEALMEPSDQPGEQVIYVISDGEETCGGDPVATAQQINQGHTRAIVNIIGFDLPDDEAAALDAVAKAGGGSFVGVTTTQAFEETKRAVTDAARRSANTVAASGANTSNSVDSAAAIRDASACVSNITRKETMALSRDRTRRAVAGETLPYDAEASALLQTRHEALQQRLDDFTKRVNAADAASRAGIDAARDAAN